MNRKKRQTLEANGYRVVTVAEFLGLSDAESAAVEVRLKKERAERPKQRAKKAVSKSRRSAPRNR